MPVTIPAPGAWPSYRSHAASAESSRKPVSGSRSRSIRSRAVSFPRERCFSSAASPPPRATSAVRSRSSATSSSIRARRRASGEACEVRTAIAEEPNSPDPSGEGCDLQSICRSSLRMLRVAVLLAALAVVLPGTASASQLIDRNASGVKLGVNRAGQALLTYRADGKLKHVLVWGAVDARVPNASAPQVEFRVDYSGGWGTYRKDVWKTF